MSRLVELGSEEQYLVTYPELGPSSYHLHADGTSVAFSYRRRPTLFMRPGHSRRVLPGACTCCPGWSTSHSGVTLSATRICACRAGGRYLYLGGNGFTSNVT